MKNAYLWDFPVPGDDFVMEKGKDYLKGYTFAKGAMTHQFCPTCGAAIMGTMTGSGKLGYNVRTLDDIGVDTLKINKSVCNLTCCVYNCLLSISTILHYQSSPSVKLIR